MLHCYAFWTKEYTYHSIYRNDDDSTKWLGCSIKRIATSYLFRYLCCQYFCDRKSIKDDTLAYSNHIDTLLHYLSYVAKVYIKYRLSIKLSKYHLFLPRIDYVGHDLAIDGIYYRMTSPTIFYIYFLFHWPVFVYSTYVP